MSFLCMSSVSLLHQLLAAAGAPCISKPDGQRLCNLEDFVKSMQIGRMCLGFGGASTGRKTRQSFYVNGICVLASNEKIEGKSFL